MLPVSFSKFYQYSFMLLLQLHFKWWIVFHYIHMSQFIHSSIGSEIISKFLLPWKSFNKHSCTYFLGHVLDFLQDAILKSMSIFWFLDNAKILSKTMVSISLPISKRECHHYSVSSPTLGIAIVLNFYYYDGCEMASGC